MKRQSDLEYSPYYKRNRGGYSPESDNQDRYGDSLRQERKSHIHAKDIDINARYPTRRSHSPRNKRQSYDEIYQMNSNREPYKSLCVSNLKHSLQESYVHEVLSQEFEKYGEFNIKFANYNGEKVAYINFRFAEDARNARHGKTKLIVADRTCRIEPVYSSSSVGYTSTSVGVTSNTAPIPSAEETFQQVLAAAMTNSYGALHHGHGSHVLRQHDAETFAAVHAVAMAAAAAEKYARVYPGNVANQTAVHHLANYSTVSSVGGARYDDSRDRLRGTAIEQRTENNLIQTNYESAHYSSQRSVTGIPVVSRHGNVSEPQSHGHYRGERVTDLDHHRRSTVRENMANGTDSADAKFPHHLHHINPEDDENATRTLFVGNLYFEITEEEIRMHFSRFGIIEDVDIKRPTKFGHTAQQGSSNAYAFIRYVNLDMAHAAKVGMSGSYINNLQCKIGYGKVLPSRCLWVGGLGPWVALEELESTFKRFGAIQRIEWPNGKHYAFVLYESVEHATEASNALRGKALGGSDKRLRIDFGEPEHIDNDGKHHQPTVLAAANTVLPTPLGDGTFQTALGGSIEQPAPTRVPNRRATGALRSSSRVLDTSLTTANALTSGATAVKSLPTIATASTIPDLITCLSLTWNGRFTLKRSSFPAHFYFVHGEKDLIEAKLLSSAAKSTVGAASFSSLQLSRRIKLDPIKLQTVSTRILEAGGVLGYALLLALPVETNQNCDEKWASPDVVGLQSRTLYHLVDYMRAKEAAGVVCLKDAVLYVFPPCDFTYELLKGQAVRLEPDYGRDEHLLLLLIRLPSDAQSNFASTAKSSYKN